MTLAKLMAFFLFHRFPAPNQNSIPHQGSQEARTAGETQARLQCLSQSSFPAGICCLTLQPASTSLPPRQTLCSTPPWLCSTPQPLALPDICVYSTTHNRIVFPGRAPSLPFSCCLPCVHFFIYIYNFFFFPQRRSGCCYFQHPPHVLEAIHALGHMAKTAEIFPVGPRRGFPSKNT